ncbi:hypothetical protein B0T20DRAFT_344232 [Sordaria brevicollis]|uniref:CCHC-type domain-containing protein n=1 Tax=Sordaria brevicollis TaxID=83679 RepID=A0AAE0PMH0_SORBR|nr:hypothetical protein B0T20DRAFT_344232 [Sordaria brevicollis]
MSAPGSPSSRKRPADDESDASGAKKARVENPEAATNAPADDIEEGEIGDSPSGSEAESTKDNEAEGESTPTHGGWNRGVSNGGLRTSFISLSTSSLRKKPQKKEAEPEPTPAETTPATPVTKAEDAKRSKSSSPTSQKLIDGWLALPPHEEFAYFKSRPRYPETWQARFLKFCETLIRHNIRWPETKMDEAQAKKMAEPDLLYKAWEQWLQDHADQKFCGQASVGAGTKLATATRLEVDRLRGFISEAFNPKDPEPVEPEKPKKLGKFPQASWTNFQLRGTKFEHMTIPPLASRGDLDKLRKSKDLWRARFIQWCQELISLNQEILTPSTPEILGVIWTLWSSWIKQIISKNKIPVGKDVARTFFLENNEGSMAVYRAIMAAPSKPKVESNESEDSEAPKQQEAQESDNEESDHDHPRAAAAEAASTAARNVGQQQSSQPSTPRNEDHDLHIRHKYFPGLDENQLFCIECASTSHDSSQCPDLTCRWCSDKHPSHTCPTRRRCTTCRQLGHSADSCTEKLAVPRDEMDCAICGSRDGHLEDTCTQLWRTFTPDPLTTSKVKALPIYCYCCGNAGHYGADCGMNMARPSTITISETWSKSNVEQLYIDPESDKIPIALQPMPKGSVLAPYNEEDPYANWDADSTAGSGRPDLGHSIAPQRHVFFEDDEDDEDEGFIRPPVNKNQGPGAQHGKIQFGGGNNRGGRGGGKNGGGNSSFNPPLPPGPPPQSLREFQSYNHGRAGDSFKSGGGGNVGGGGGRGRGGGGGGRGRGGFSRGGRGGRGGKNW